MLSQLERQLQEQDTPPFLFVGSGMSIRYLGLENWRDLLTLFCVCGKPFQYYYSTANSCLPKVATLLSDDFHHMWWADDKYKESRKTYSSQADHSDSALKIEICKHISRRQQSIVLSEEIQEEISLLSTSCVDGIITTNWDNLLEKIFPEFTIYIGQEELLSQSQESISEIYKIHGCCTSPNSLVLTDEDYARYNDKNAYLAAKLLTIFIEHPVIFFGILSF